ncbi:hypothetical protein H310_02163 [Aphanomyces invadans]|uniref:RGS domain-containing protein n=1 Tax=Aphanomyces invadans TaxID=157072 RepID=A0A024UN32_9STRA|nr:hypothetical protein H310_02163 [Aphanomyces invadans]ETW07714.1 hypothetical protein H310_02163 [Aphanomyces invadans]|eukprot:XP_008863807.1 hypothetical protein H310_02163 [Aphanomyces invadans]
MNSTHGPVNSSLINDRGPPKYDSIRVLVQVALVMSSYAPIAIFAYYCKRDSPLLRYRNPVEMAVTTFAAYLNGLARCLRLLFNDEISCTTRYLMMGLPTECALLGYILTQLHVVLTFHMTEMMVAMVEDSSQTQPSRKVHWLRQFVRSGAFSKHRVGLYLVWGCPLFIILYVEDYSTGGASTCSDDLVNRVSTLHTVQLVLSTGLSVLLSFKLSKVVDNYGLRRSFQISNRVLILLAIVDVLFLVVFPDALVVVEYSVDNLLAVLMSHAVICIHIVYPLIHSCRSRRSPTNETFHGTMAILDAYLRTAKGYTAFATFSKSEFAFECVVAWKTLVDFRTQAPGSLDVDEIYRQHLAPCAPFSLEGIVPNSVRTRYTTACEANGKYAVSSTAVSLNCHYYDVLLDAVVTVMVTNLLPRFQRHELGAGWTTFVIRHHTESVLELMLQSEGTDNLPVAKMIQPKKNRLSVIESRRDSVVTASQDDMPWDVDESEP